MRNRLELSVILPAYNEEDTIDKVLDGVDFAVKQTGLDYELIVVNDGSVDDTYGKVANYANNNGHVKIVSHKRNLGKGYAVKTGFENAMGDTIIFMDSDLDIDPIQIGRYVQALKYGDIVIASKWHPESRVEMPLLRRFLSRGFGLLFKLLTGLRISDTQTGLKVAKRNMLEEILPRLAVKRYAFDAELLSVANLFGFKIVEFPVKLCMSGLGIFPIREIYRMFEDLLGITYRLRFLKWYNKR